MGETVHAAAPRALENRPTGQIVQPVAAPPPCTIPNPHTVQNVAPTKAEKEPVGHILQAIAPVCPEKYPAAHARHVVELNEKDPGSQAVHVVAPCSGCVVPRLHMLHAEAAADGLALPARHGTHAAAPTAVLLATLYEPDGQGMHATLPTCAAIVPLGHPIHCVPKIETVPTGQSEQNDAPTVAL